jgi:hypothetical protein
MKTEQEGTLTAKDAAAIERAKRLPNQLWHEVMDMENAADTEEARQILHGIRTHKYHMDESGVC